MLPKIFSLIKSPVTLATNKLPIFVCRIKAAIDKLTKDSLTVFSLDDELDFEIN
jgi:hypothetical protein